MSEFELKAIVAEMTAHLAAGCACCHNREWLEKLSAMVEPVVTSE